MPGIYGRSLVAAGLYGATSRRVQIRWTNGTKEIFYQGCSGIQFPQMSLKTANAVVDSRGVLSVPVGGNPSDRVFNQPAIDSLLSLADADFTPGHNIKFRAVRIWRDSTLENPTTGEALVTNVHERVDQHNASGVATPLSANTGGMVWRINGSTVTNQGNIGCLVPALHWSYGVKAASSEDMSIGYSSGYDPSYPGPSTRRMDATNGLYNSTNGHFALFAAQRNYSGANAAIHLYTDDDARITYPDTHNYPLPGRATNFPTTDSESGGFALLAQSTNTAAGPLKKSYVWPPWYGEAVDIGHLESIIANLKADWNRDPYLEYR